ncbi:MAG: Bacterial alpha-L-rhamnosidase [Segetibacter sp.]|nr:Bacterial alpha-L-rhamnosidase [Segetibacter sp.]
MKKRLTYLTIFLTGLVVILASFRDRVVTTIQVKNLRIEGLVNPKGVDVTLPRLSWEVGGEQRGLEQTAYQILVASSAANIAGDKADIWNSGKVSSNQNVHVAFAGGKLKSRMQCYWKVKVWTNKGEASYSSPAHFTVGLLDEKDWKAKWTGLDRSFPWDTITKMSRLSARYFRKDFALAKEVKKATAYISGLGLYELYINGQKIGDQVLAPGPTDFSKTVKYNTFDVTNNIKQGMNAVATTLGNGRFYTMRQQYKPHKWHNFGFPKMLLQLEIEYADGSKQTVVSDDTWKVTADGPIRTNNEYDGEEYDATKEFAGWNMAGFNDSKWLKAELVKSPLDSLLPLGMGLEAQMNENMKVMETLKPISIKENKPGTYILDLGQNIAGWLKIKVQGKRGSKVTLKFAESLQKNGQLYVENLRDALVTDVYTLKGQGVETWAPKFVYHGFRYAEVTGLKYKPKLEDFVGEVVYDDMKTIGLFETSDRTINQVYKNAYWGIRDNYKGMPVDCPQRDERQPWLGDRSTGAYGESFIFDNSRMYAKWLDDIEESQTAEGSIPDVAPSFWFYYKDGVTWPGTYLQIANMVYNQYGDVESVKKHYPSMKKWMNYMKGKYMKNYIITKDSYGDWCVPPESPELIHAKDSSRITEPKLLSTATYYHMLQLMKKFATLTGKENDAQGFEALGVKVKEAFTKAFYNSETKQYGNNTVTANILPLAFDIIPEGDKEAVFKHITDKIMIENNGHISTGVIGTQWLLRWLTYNGRADIAYRLASNRTYPSWGYMAENGATTIWELWNGNTANPRMNSQNHVMLLGDLIVWYYENLGGIKAAEPGFKKIEMKPSFVEGLNYVNASYHSINGLIKSEWREGVKWSWNITIPGNTKAIVYIPAPPNFITEGGKDAAKADGVKFLRMEGNNAVFEVGSGTYTFRTKEG